MEVIIIIIIVIIIIIIIITTIWMQTSSLEVVDYLKDIKFGGYYPYSRFSLSLQSYLPTKV